MFALGLGVRTLGAAGGVVVSLAVACGSAGDYPFDKNPLTSAQAGTGTGPASGGAASLGGASGSGSAGHADAVGGNGVGGSGGTPASTGGVGPNEAGRGGSDSAPPGGTGGSSADDAGGAAGTGDGEGGAGGEAPTVDCTKRGADALGFDGHCYVFDATKVTFAEAAAACEGREAHLVTISSEERTVSEFLAENSFVWQLANQTAVWIAATDGRGPHQKGGGTFSRWLTDEAMLLDNWTPGQPNNAQSSCQENDPCSCNDGACYEHCGFLWETAGRQMDAVPGWNDRLCDHRIAFVCEWDVP